MSKTDQHHHQHHQNDNEEGNNVVVYSTSSSSSSTHDNSNQEKNRILFGSCYSQHYIIHKKDNTNTNTNTKDTTTTTINPHSSKSHSHNYYYHDYHPIWENIINRNASSFVWVGDAIYADDFDTQTIVQKIMLYKPKTKEATPIVLHDIYHKLLYSDVGYHELISSTKNKQQQRSTDFLSSDSSENLTTIHSSTNNHHHNVPPVILGAFDDHDYGTNNGDRMYQYKKESAIEYMNFLKYSNSFFGFINSSNNNNNNNNNTLTKLEDDDSNHPLQQQQLNPYEDVIDDSNVTFKNSNSRVNFTIMEQRARLGDGVYGVKVFDFSLDTKKDTNYLLTDEEAGFEPTLNGSSNHLKRIQLSNRSVAIILLDIRTHKDPWPTKDKKIHNQFFSFSKTTTTTSSHSDDKYGDFLGTKQWLWLEHILNTSTAKVNVIVSGLQVHADRYFDGNAVEDWSNFPFAQHKLYQLILNSNVSAPIIVSGDVHMAELLRKDCRKLKTVSSNPPNIETTDRNKETVMDQTSNHQSRMILEVTTSGMTHSWGTNICARPNSSLACRTPYLHRALKYGMHLAHNNDAWTDIVYINRQEATTNKKSASLSTSNDGTVPTYDVGVKGGYQYSLDHNFGEFEFDWESNSVIIRILGEDVTKPILLSTKWDIDLLSGLKPIPDEIQYVTDSDFQKKYQQMISYNTPLLTSNRVETISGNDLYQIHPKDDWFCVNYRGDPSVSLKLFGVVSPILLSMFVALAPFILLLVFCFRHQVGKLKNSLTLMKVKIE